jgi:hypothetical protein
MADPDQYLRITFFRDSDERALLDVFRNGNDYYSTHPGGIHSHRHYHESGQVATKTSRYDDGKIIYIDKTVKSPPLEMVAHELLHAVNFRNERCWFDTMALIRHRRGKRVDRLVRIDSRSMGESVPLTAAVGLTPTAAQLDEIVAGFCDDGSYRLLHRELLDRENGPSMYAVVFCAAVDEHRITKRPRPIATVFTAPAILTSLSGGKLEHGASFRIVDALGRFGPGPPKFVDCGWEGIRMSGRYRTWPKNRWPSSVEVTINLSLG